MKIKLEPITFCDGKACAADIYAETRDAGLVRIGSAVDCDLGRWVVMTKDAGIDVEPWESFDGCYAADSLEGLAYAMRECIDGLDDEPEILPPNDARYV